MHYETFKDASNEYRWRLVASNGNIVADSSEGYKNKVDMLEILHNIVKFNRDIPYPMITEAGDQSI